MSRANGERLVEEPSDTPYAIAVVDVIPFVAYSQHTNLALFYTFAEIEDDHCIEVVFIPEMLIYKEKN